MTLNEAYTRSKRDTNSTYSAVLKKHGELEK